MNLLPDEIIYKFCNYLNQNEYINLMMTNKNLYLILSNNINLNITWKMKKNVHLPNTKLISNIKNIIVSNIFDTIDLIKLKNLQSIIVSENKLTSNSVKYFLNNMKLMIFISNDPFTNENINYISCCNVFLFNNKRITKIPKKITYFVGRDKIFNNNYK